MREIVNKTTGERGQVVALVRGCYSTSDPSVKFDVYRLRFMRGGLFEFEHLPVDELKAKFDLVEEAASTHIPMPEKVPG